MSKYEEIVWIIETLSNDSEEKGYELVQCAESLGRVTASFSGIINGTNDSSAKTVYGSFITAQKELYKAAKALLTAASTGHDWCEGTSPKLQLKKVRR